MDPPEEEKCDIPSDKPQEKPLPPFGEIYLKRETERINAANVSSYQNLLDDRRRKCLLEPLEQKCLPKTMLLPMAERPGTEGRYLETNWPIKHDPGSLMKKVKVGKQYIDVPGWLIEMSNEQLQGALDAKELLATGKPLCELVGPVYQAIASLGTDITYNDVKQILRRCPLSSKGWSFSHFMFVAGNPSYAKKKGVLQEPADAACESDGSASKAHMKSKNVIDRLYQLPKIANKDNWPPKEDNKATASGDESGYSPREQLFYSSLLYCEMYDTMQEFERIYFQGLLIPVAQDKFLKRQQKLGFGAFDIGTRKIGFAEWDRPLPPLPKLSPYLADLPLVGKRVRVIKPNGKVMIYKRSQTYIRPLFLSVKPTDEPTAKIRVLEDAQRIRAILELLASQGNCMAMLPNVHSILHLSDTLLHKLEIVKQQKGPKATKIYRGNDLLWICKEAKNLFRPHGLPPQIAGIPNLVTYPDGLKLREICRQVREQHWSYICLRKNQFREKVWKVMHVERIPCGNLRENFVYAFDTYLPAKSTFPIIIDNALPW